MTAAMQKDCSFNKAKSAFSMMDLERVTHDSWVTLREGSSTFELGNLEIRTDHLNAQVFGSLARAIKAVDQKFPKEFWEWMVLPVSSSIARGRQETLPRAKAFMVFLAQVIRRSPGDVAAAASTAYLSLLEATGAVPSQSMLAQPSVFFWLLKLLDPLCTYSQRSDSNANMSEAADGAAEVCEEHPAGEDDIDIAVDACSPAEALDLLTALVAFLRSNASSTPPTIRGMALDKLIALALHPIEEAVAQVATAGLSAVVDAAGAPEDIRRAAIISMRAILPAVLMTQESKLLNQQTVPKLVQSTRAVALEFVCDTIHRHPDLLSSRAHTKAQDADDVQMVPAGTPEPILGLDAPFLTMLQLICIKAPERAEWRLAAAESVAHLLTRTVSSYQENKVHEAALDYVDQLLHCDRQSWRSIAVDVTAYLIESGEQLVGSVRDEARATFEKRLLNNLVERCSDATPSVRARALTGVASAVLHLSKYPTGVSVVCEVSWNVAQGREASPPQPSETDLVALFARAAQDEVSKVRRVALSLFDASLPIVCSQSDAGLGFFKLELLARLVNDESVLVRRAAVCSISLLLRTCATEAVASLWVGQVLPLTFDPESSVVQRAVSEVDAVILDPLSHPGGMDAAALSLVSRALERDSDSIQYLRSALRFHAKGGTGTVLDELVTTILHDTRERLTQPFADWPLLSWILLEELAALGAVSHIASAPMIVLKAWETFERNSTTSDLEGSKLGLQILSVIEHMASSLPAASAAALRDDLYDRLGTLTLAAGGVQTALRLIGKIEARRTKDSVARMGGAWHLALTRQLDAKLLEFVKQFEGTGLTQGKFLCRCLFTLGELALFDTASAEAVTHRAISELKALASNTILGKIPQVQEHIAIRNHAFGSLGKVCLRREELAKGMVELFVLHLNSREPFAVRSNVLLVLRDLCQGYTSLVDRFMMSMADLLRDDNVFLRKQAVMVFASLLSERYVTFRGGIVHRFLYVLSDPVDSIRTLAEAIVVRVLHPSNTALFANSFLDVVCALNNWKGHSAFQGAYGNEQFALVQFPKRRSMIYSFLLSLMTNEQKLSVYQHLVSNFLAAFLDAENHVELPQAREDAGGQALHDVLALLMSKELRMSFAPRRVGEGHEAEQEQEESASETTGVALKMMLKQIICQHLMPVLIPLKHLMENKHSPFLGELRRCMCGIVREFKEEVKDIMAADPQLASELAFDLGREEQKCHETADGWLSAKRAMMPTVEKTEARLAAAPHKKQRLQHLATPQKKTGCASSSNTGRPAASSKDELPPRRIKTHVPPPLPTLHEPSSSGLMGLLMRSRATVGQQRYIEEAD